MIKKTLFCLIKMYQVALSPWCHKCRYIPTCSCYATEALEKHSTCKAIRLIGLRLLRCHPWSKKDMYDPVPSP
ncbi:MAG: membrane protein insertion efficiency factor YidD [Legionellales bacterium]|nr:membrane protein insertion efficiency factor YidD [Legionellales bacterium]